MIPSLKELLADLHQQRGTLSREMKELVTCVYSMIMIRAIPEIDKGKKFESALKQLLTNSSLNEHQRLIVTDALSGK